MPAQLESASKSYEQINLVGDRVVEPSSLSTYNEDRPFVSAG